MLIQQNRKFLVGAVVDPSIRAAALISLRERDQISAVTYLHIEYVGPARVFVVGAVDLVGNESERDVAVRLNALEQELQQNPRIVRAVLTLSSPDDAPLAQ